MAAAIVAGNLDARCPPERPVIRSRIREGNQRGMKTRRSVSRTMQRGKQTGLSGFSEATTSLSEN
jgi:hypothetical protein